MNWKEFKPTIVFLLKFMGLYLTGNLAYGFFITSYQPAADPVTIWVTGQVVDILSATGWPCTPWINASKATVTIVHLNQGIVSVYEGCNGINVAIIFVAFLISFGPFTKRLAWFLPVGVVGIHIANLLRIVALFLVSLKMPNYLYFTHKYLFTAFIYAIVFFLWIIWIRINFPKTHGD